MKPTTACKECRAGKRKCIALTTNVKCLQCSKRQIECSLHVHSHQQKRFLLPEVPHEIIDTKAQIQLPSQQIREELVMLYLRYLHNKPHTLFHEPTLLESVRTGTISYNVLYGILGVSARHVDGLGRV